MRATGALVLVLFATDALVGQQVSQVMQFEDVLAAMAERGLELPADGERPIERVARLVQALIQAEASTVNRAQRPRTRVVAHPQQGILLVSGPQSLADLVTGIHKQLGNPERRGLVVQCSMLTLPWKLAREHRLAPRSATPVGEAAAGELMKAAVQAKGTLRNLPEAMAEPLLPFTLGAGADGKPVGPGPVVHAEALLVGDHEALFSMQIAWPDGAPPAGQKPQAPKPQPQKPRDDGTAFRLQTGAGVLLLGPVARNPGDDEPVTVLWVRFASVVPRAAMKPDGGRAPRRK